MKKVISVLVFLFICFFSFAQKQGNIWYFGNAGLDFNPGAPVALTNSAMNQWEGVSSIADANGALLFYTDGQSVWNKNHITMPNGTGLHGNMSSCQSALIVQKPGSSNLYYIFTSDVVPNQYGFQYSIVDMNMNGGLGDVITLNTPVYTPTAEKLAAVNHSNGMDVWIVSHEFNTNNFYAYTLTSSGLNSTPVISSVGPVVGATAYDEIGYLRISPDGTKAAMDVEGSNIWVLFDFSTSTGVLSNPITLTSPGMYCYGTEFSPNSKVLYGSVQSPNGIVQYDISSGNAATIAASMINLPISSNLSAPAALCVAPDHKVYYVRDGDTYIGVINSPNVIGPGCNPVDNGVFLGGKTSALGLPNMNATLFNTSFTFTQLCLGDSTYFEIPDTTGIVSVNWNFGDAISGINNNSTLLNPAHLFSIPATFHVRLITHRTGFTDTTYANVTITTSPVVNLGSDTSFCTGSSIVLNAGGGFTGYSWQDNSTDSTLTVSLSGTYWVTVSNGTCSGSDSIQLNAIPCNYPVTNFTVSNTAFCNNGCVNFSDISTNNPVSWQWNFQGGVPSSSTVQNPVNICYPNGGNYNVSLIACNLNGCDTLDMNNFITVYPPPNFVPINQIGDTLFSVPGFATYQWYDGSGLIVGANDYFFVASHNGTYSVQVTDQNGCNAAATIIGVIASVDNIDFQNGNLTSHYSNGIISVNLDANSNSNIKLELIDNLGRIHKSLNKKVQSGINHIDINSGLLATGIYFIRIVSGTNSFTDKVAVVN